MSNRRYYNPATIRKLWVDTNGKCPICKKELITLKEPLEEYRKEKQHWGEMAHIISLNALKAIGSQKLIRPNNKKYKNEIVPFKYFEEAKNPEDKGSYTEAFLNSYENLVILCLDCHKWIDGKKPELIPGTFLEENDEIQINLKSQKSKVELE